jgi:MFS family permease
MGGLSYGTMGWILSVSLLSAGIGLAFLGVPYARIGARKMTVVGLLIVAVGTQLFAFGPANVASLMVARIITGIGVGVLFMAPYSLVTEWFTGTKHLSTAIGVTMTSDGFGTLAALYAWSFVIIALGWQLGIGVSGWLLFATAIAAWFFFKEPSLASSASPRTQTGWQFYRKAYGFVLRNGNLMRSTIWVTGIYGFFGVCALWLPTIFMEDFGWSANASGFMGSAFMVFGIPFSVFGGILSDRIFKRRKGVAIWSGIGVTAMGFLSAFAIDIGNPWLLFAAVALMGIFTYPGAAAAMGMIGDNAPEEFLGPAWAVWFAFGLGIGYFLAPLIMGYLRDAMGGWSTSVIIITVVFGILMMIVPMLWATDPYREKWLREKTTVAK